MIRITSLNRKIKKIKWGLKDLGKEVQPHPFKVYKRFKENKAARTLSEAEAQKITAELQKIHQDNEYARRMTMHESEALARLANLIGDIGLKDESVTVRLMTLRNSLRHANATTDAKRREQILDLISKCISTVANESTINAHIIAIIGDLKKDEVEVIKDMTMEERDVEVVLKEMEKRGIPLFKYHASEHIRKAVQLAKAAEDAFLKMEEIGIRAKVYNSNLEKTLIQIKNMLSQGWVTALDRPIKEAIELAKKEEEMMEKLADLEKVAIMDEKADYDFILKAIG